MIHQHHRITTAMLALAIAATIAPAALADPQPLAKAEAQIAAAGRTTTAVRPNPDQQTLTRAGGQAAPCSEVCSAGGYFGSSSQLATASSSRPSHNPGGASRPRLAVVHVAAPSGGFDWGDASVGAGGMLALTVIGVGLVLTVGHRRSHSVTPTTRANPQGQH
jgi:hypothetical protein